MAQPAALPPPLPELDSGWSRLVTAPDPAGIDRTWHLLDSAVTDSSRAAGLPTLLCVHGNPTWSYLWRGLVAAPPAGWRVIAVDQLGMGYSERPAGPRTLADRIADLGALTAALGLTGTVVPVAHDWGGPIALGWALGHRAQVAGLILTNTAVHQPAGSPAPAVIRLARLPGARQLICQWTPAFLAATTALSRHPVIPGPVRRAFAAPYSAPARRRAVAEFVADIPLDDGHPSAAALAGIVTDLPELARLPALLLWGAQDPVFSDRYLRDLLGRLPAADVHRFGTASHLVTEAVPDLAGLIGQWLQRRLAGVGGVVGPAAVGAAGVASAVAGGVAPPVVQVPGLTDRLTERADDPAPAVIQLSGHSRTVVSFAQLHTRVHDLAAGLAALGVVPGDRVALLVRPGPDLTAAVYACWRLGAVVVLADAGLGARGMSRALRSAGPSWIIGIPAGLAVAKALGIPGTRIAAARLPGVAARLLGSHASLPGLTAIGAAAEVPQLPEPDADCAIVFTSGATGPAKGVLYRHRQLAAQLELLRQTYDIGPHDRFVAAFAPFALYGPALGIASVVPDMDVTAPATLTAAALADAVAAVDATVVFASPAALVNVAATAGALTSGQRQALHRPRLLLSAGAPVGLGLQRTIAALLPNATVHTPYGMTEALPITDIDLATIEKLPAGDGVCVGTPVSGVCLAISELDNKGHAVGELSDVAGVIGEVCVQAGHIKDHYDRLWATEAASSRNVGWHRTGDVGHLDDRGRLWIEGRLIHVITGAGGPVTPVPVEQRIEHSTGVAAAALVGVGPAGTQQTVAVVTTGEHRTWRNPMSLAEHDLAAAVRRAAGLPLAAVLTVDAMPVDIRHNSKIDRAALGLRATRFLSGRG